MKRIQNYYFFSFLPKAGLQFPSWLYMGIQEAVDVDLGFIELLKWHLHFLLLSPWRKVIRDQVFRKISKLHWHCLTAWKSPDILLLYGIETFIFLCVIGSLCWIYGRQTGGWPWPCLGSYIQGKIKGDAFVHFEGTQAPPKTIGIWAGSLASVFSELLAVIPSMQLSLRTTAVKNSLACLLENNWKGR